MLIFEIIILNPEINILDEIAIRVLHIQRDDYFRLFHLTIDNIRNKQMKLRFISFTLFLGLCLSLNAWGGGFQVNLQGQKQNGMAHAGIGLALDNSAILFNPGALGFVDSLGSISAGVSLIIPRIVYLDPHSTYTSQVVHHVSTPLSAYAHVRLKKNSPLSIGFGLYNPFGSRVQWEDDWKGQFLLREISLKTFFYQATVSYRIGERLGIGLGYVFANGAFALRKAIPVQDSTGIYGEANIEGKAKGQGFNMGIYYKANNKLSIGLNFRTGVKVKVENGTANFVSADALKDYFPNTNFNTQLNLPFVSGIGVGYALTEKLKLAADVNYVGWSSYDSLKFDFVENTDKLKDMASPRHHKNSFIYRAGVQYQVNNFLYGRAGAYFDQSPVPDGYLSPETPDTDKIGLTAGFSVVFNNFYTDFSILFLEGMKRTDTNLETQFDATYKSRAIIPGINIGMKF